MRPKSDSERILRTMVQSAYAIQEIRISTGLRLCANFRHKLQQGEAPEDSVRDNEADSLVADEIGAIPQKSPDELSEKAVKLIDQLKKDFTRLTDGIAKNRSLPVRAGFKGEGLITEYAEAQLVRTYLETEKTERRAFEDIKEHLEGIPVWTEFMKDVRGIGPSIAGYLITYFDVNMDRPSQWWAYAGLDLGPDGRARGRYKEHLIERQYKKKDGSIGTRLSTTFSPKIQSRLLGAFASSMIRCGSPYKKAYDDYKHRIVSDPNRVKIESKDFSKAVAAGADPRNLWVPRRIHLASVRYMMKMLLLDLWTEWRHLEGLPLVGSYEQQRQAAIEGREPFVSYHEMQRGYSHKGRPPLSP